MSQNDFIELHFYIPDGIGIKEIMPAVHCMISTRKIKSGEIIFTNNSVYFPSGTKIRASFPIFPSGDMRTRDLNEIDHSVNRNGDGREYFGFDGFSNHSCNPNSATIWTSKTQYNVVALRDINVEEPITCDYTTFVFSENYDNYTFECDCGSNNCKQIIKV